MRDSFAYLLYAMPFFIGFFGYAMGKSEAESGSGKVATAGFLITWIGAIYLTHQVSS